MEATLSINVRADLFRIAAHAVATEDTRFYLGGVFVEPHADGGVTLVATDGRRMVVALDESGSASAPAIIRLSASALRECKLARRDVERRIKIDGNEARVYVTKKDEEAVLIAACGRCVVDATYPDWRRLMPSRTVEPKAFAAYSPRYLNGFSALTPEIARSVEFGAGAMSIYAPDDRTPAIVRWSDVGNIFGILMPMRHKVLGGDHLPAFAAPPADATSDTLAA